MIDTQFVDAIPQTANGDTDWSTLQQSHQSEQFHIEYVIPRNDIEKALYAIWTKVLSTSEFGVLDNFFEIGGHSLSATQVMSRIRDQLGITLPVSSIFETPTISDLAQRLEKEGDVHSDKNQHIISVDRNECLPLSFSQQRILFLQQLEGTSSTFNMPFAVRMEGPLDILMFEKAINTIMDRHEILRSSFLSDDGDSRVVIEN